MPRIDEGAKKLLLNYHGLLARVDHICQEIESQYADHLACRAGCAGCCRQITLFPVEAMALAEAVECLPTDEAERIRDRARKTSPGDPCPLLEDQLCLLYSGRPVICRTHGLPILTDQDGQKSVDFCPRNFRDVVSLPGTAVIDLDRLNMTLAAINALFVEKLSADTPLEQERIPIAEALTSWL